jgi:hypothetical protein
VITKVEVRSALGLLLTLQLDATDGIVVENIDGLDPVKATLTSSSFATLDGAQFQASRRETRNIIMTLGLEPDYVTTSVRDLRNQLYQFFMPKATVNLRFFLEDDLVASIDAVVESFETILFTQTPTATISLICYDPDFTNLTPVEIEGDTVDDATTFTIDYDGTADTGFVFTLLVDRTLDAFTIYQTPGDAVVRTMDFAADLVADDVVTISTVRGNKYITLLRSSVITSLLYGLSPQSNWLELQPGANAMRVLADGAAIPFTIDYTTRYGGL